MIGPLSIVLERGPRGIVIGYVYMILLTPQKERRTKVSVPMNIRFCMHRYGEWFMLMFGESIISLLIVDGNNESFDYNIAFFSGILSVVVLAHLHFAVEPHSPESHALGRSRQSSFWYTIIVPIYSIALIAIGVSYKMFFYEFISGYYQDGGGDAHRLLVESGEGNQGGNSYTNYYKQEQRQQFAANLFSGSIATVLICADLMLLLHKGLAEVLRQAQSLSVYFLASFVFCKLLLLVLLGILCMFQNDPHIIAFCGLAAIVIQAILRHLFVFLTKQRTQISLQSVDSGISNDKGDGLISVSTWISTQSALPVNAHDERNRQELLAVFEREDVVDTEKSQGHTGAAGNNTECLSNHELGSEYAKMDDSTS